MYVYVCVCVCVCARVCVQVGGLASENVRWAEAVESFRRQERTLCGDVLLITAFVSYLGYFTKRYRLALMDATWRPYLSQLQVRTPPPATAHVQGWRGGGGGTPPPPHTHK